MQSLIPVNKETLLGTPKWLDVRAPIEFAEGSLPSSQNIGIMNNDERAAVGKVYKDRGSESAKNLGHQLVSGDVKSSRVKAWVDFFKQNPDGKLFCFRGGLRSQIAQQWLADEGLKVARLEGGYKSARQFFIQQLQTFSQRHRLCPVSGPTGSGKSTFIENLRRDYPVVNLEDLANHRGSAFGQLAGGQPTQIDFENRLSLETLKMEDLLGGRPLIVEDESRLIGKCVLPREFFDTLRASPVIWIETSFEQRVENIYQDYIANLIGLPESQVLQTFAYYESAVQKISPRLGGLKAGEILNLIKEARQGALLRGEFDSNRAWIAELLICYYDPMYLGSLNQRNPKVLFRGSAHDAREFITKNLARQD